MLKIFWIYMFWAYKIKVYKYIRLIDDLMPNCDEYETIF